MRVGTNHIANCACSFPDGMSGECFLVERYESDVEEGEEGEGEHILLTLTDRFLEEKDINGKVYVSLVASSAHP